jgi:membrane associated rhomboid family serine protease
MILPGNIFIKKQDLTDEGIKRWFFAPAFMLVLLNLVVHFFIGVTQPTELSLNADIKILKENSNLSVMNQMHVAAQDPILRDVVAQKVEKDPFLFVKDRQFWSRAQSMEFFGDQVQIAQNKNILARLKKVFKNSTQEIYGLGPESKSFMNWVTYQFTHASLFHLFSNVIFLLLIVAILQSFVNVGWILSVYLLGGFASGLAYLLFCDNLSLPLLGASGSVSALIAFLCVIKANENIKWSYFISPLPAGHGNIFLPAYLLFPIYLVSDFTNLLIDTQGVSNSIAHSAHVGGALCGLAMGIVYRIYSHQNEQVFEY